MIEIDFEEPDIIKKWRQELGECNFRYDPGGDDFVRWDGCDIDLRIPDPYSTGLLPVMVEHKETLVVVRFVLADRKLNVEAHEGGSYTVYFSVCAKIGFSAEIFFERWLDNLENDFDEDSFFGCVLSGRVGILSIDPMTMVHSVSVDRMYNDCITTTVIGVTFGIYMSVASDAAMLTNEIEGYIWAMTAGDDPHDLRFDMLYRSIPYEETYVYYMSIAFYVTRAIEAFAFKHYGSKWLFDHSIGMKLLMRVFSYIASSLCVFRNKTGGVQLVTGVFEEGVAIFTLDESDSAIVTVDYFNYIQGVNEYHELPIEVLENEESELEVFPVIQGFVPGQYSAHKILEKFYPRNDSLLTNNAVNLGVQYLAILCVGFYSFLNDEYSLSGMKRILVGGSSKVIEAVAGIESRTFYKKLFHSKLIRFGSISGQEMAPVRGVYFEEYGEYIHSVNREKAVRVLKITHSANVKALKRLLGFTNYKNVMNKTCNYGIPLYTLPCPDHGRKKW